MEQRDVTQSDRWAKVATQGRNVRELVGLAVIIVTFIVTGTVFILEVQNKPSVEQVKSLMAPVRDRADRNEEDINGVKVDLGTMGQDIKRVKQVQGYQLEQSAWQGDVLDHIGQRKRGPAPVKPAILKAKERELLR
jgi:hypothetical protein